MGPCRTFLSAADTHEVVGPTGMRHDYFPPCEYRTIRARSEAQPLFRGKYLRQVVPRLRSRRSCRRRVARLVAVGTLRRGYRPATRRKSRMDRTRRVQEAYPPRLGSGARPEPQRPRTAGV